MTIPSWRSIPGTNFVVDAFRYRPIQQDKVYFLTHAHSDHYGGLLETWSGGPIYCSEVTASLVHLLTGVPVDLLRPVPLDTVVVVQGVRVTFIDANHCPGAAQILFELPNGRRYIHCGDMRYSPRMLDNPHLQRFKNADAVFLDTTYAHPKHCFPAQAMHQIVHSWFSRKFATGCAILLPIVITFYVTYHFLQLFDGIFSPLYKRLFGFEVFGLGFMTSVAFIILTGVFFSSWLGSWTLALGEWIIKRLPLVKHIYSASKQVSGALNPDSGEGSKAFQECVLARHPRHGEFAIAFITGRTVLQTHEGDMRLVSVYVPTNHVYVGDIFLLDERDIIHTNLSVREGLEIVVSVGMALPPSLTAIIRRI